MVVPKGLRYKTREPTIRYSGLFGQKHVPASTIIPRRNTEKKIESVQNPHNTRERKDS